MLIDKITPATLDTRRINVMQGHVEISNDPGCTMTTVLGSCVSACIFDHVAFIGGMNHFLLAGDDDRAHADSERYGAYLMEVLINEMIKAGAHRATMRAHLYGGANLHEGMAQIGTANAKFAVDFLARDGISVTRTNLGGKDARRVDFRAASGQARCRILSQHAPEEIPVAASSTRRSMGQVELF